jgi:hypothetical protein
MLIEFFVNELTVMQSVSVSDLASSSLMDNEHSDTAHIVARSSGPGVPEIGTKPNELFVAALHLA